MPITCQNSKEVVNLNIIKNNIIMATRTDYRTDLKKLSDNDLLKKINHLWKMIDYGHSYFKAHNYAKALAQKRGLIKGV